MEIRSEVSCEKCAHAPTQVLSSQTHFTTDRQGERVHDFTIYTLLCTSPQCQHVFQKKIQSDDDVK